MAVQSAIRVRLPNRPGELLKVVRELARLGVNLEAVAGVAGSGQEGVLELLVNDAEAASRALKDAGLAFDVTQVAVVWLPNKPGTLAKACEALANAGINLNATFIVA